MALAAEEEEAEQEEAPPADPPAHPAGAAEPLPAEAEAEAEGEAEAEAELEAEEAAVEVLEEAEETDEQGVAAVEGDGERSGPGPAMGDVDIESPFDPACVGESHDARDEAHCTNCQLIIGSGCVAM